MNDDNIRDFTEGLESLRRQLALLTNVYEKTLTEEQRRQLNLDDATKQVKKFSDNLDDTNPILKAQRDYLNDQNEQFRKLKRNFEALGTSLKESVLNNTDRTFSKYNSSIDSASGALGNLSKMIYGDGANAFTKLLEITTTVTKSLIGQYDRLNKVTDELNKVGATIGITTTQFRDMAHSAGVTSKNLEVLARPLKDFSINLTSLATNTTEGTKEFVKLTSISREQRMSYQRLGISQEELIKNQTDYLTLQAMSGRNIRAEVKDRQALQRETLEYTDNLMVLANLTGQDVESIKKKQQEATKELDWQIKQFQLDEKARELDREGKTEEAKAVKAEAKARQDALNQITGYGNDIVTKGVRSILATGSIYTEEAQALTRMGLADEVEKLQSALKRGVKAEDAAAEFQDAYNKHFRETVKNVGTAVQYSKDTGTQFGITVESLINLNKQGKQNTAEEQKLARERIEAQKAAGFDTSKTARALLTEAEIFARQKVDQLALAATAASVALTAFSATAMLKTGSSGLGGVTSLLSGRLGTVIKGVVTKAALPLMALSTMYGAYRGFTADKDAGIGKSLLNAGSSGINSLSFGLLGSSADQIAERAGKSTPAEENKDIPKLAKGGVVEGPTTGYPAILHGKEMVIPLTESTKLGDMNLSSLGLVDEETEKHFDKFEQSLEKSDKALNKLVFTLVKLNEVNKKDLELTEDAVELREKQESKTTQGGSTGLLDGLKNMLLGKKSEPSAAPGPGPSPSSSESSSGQGNTGTTSAPSGSVQGLLDFIGKHESRGDYNTLVGGKKANLTEMTVQQVLELQKQMRQRGSGFESSAVGKYQIINKTLLGIMSKAGVSLTDKFDQSTQDKLAIALLKNRGLDSYLNKSLNPEAFADNLSKEWASLPYSSGSSYYAKVGSNKSLTSRNELMSSLPKAKSGGSFEGPDDGYLVQLHGDEMVIPTPKISSVVKKDLNDVVMPNTVGSSDVNFNIADRLKDVVDIKITLMDTMKSMKTDFKTIAEQYTRRPLETTGPMLETNTDVMGILTTKLDTLIDRVAESNSTQEKILQYTRI